jgi:KaiC/GvpD/RAD55 family RecA-like ATPase
MKLKKEIERVKTGIPGFDELVGGGIEKNSIVLVAGGTGSGKTNFSSQFLYYGAVNGEKGLYITFEENPEQIKRHLANFGMDFDKLEKKGKIRFVKVDVFQIAKAVEAALLKAKGELMIKLKGLPTIIPPRFKPQRIVVDSLSALAAVFKTENYRYFIFQFFSQLKETGATTFAISETGQEPTEYSRTGIEEFLGDGVIVLYNIKHGDTRLRALEVLKMRGIKHEKKIVPFKITNRGIVVYPKQSIITAMRE